MNYGSTEACKVVVFGVSDLALLAHAYLTQDSPHTVVAFTAHLEYVNCDSLLGLPVIAFEDLEAAFEPARHRLFALMSSRDSNRARAGVFCEARRKGYRFVSYVSSKAATWPGLSIGENTAILEAAIVNPHATIGDDVIVGPGALVAHHSRVGDHCFVAARSVVLGGVSLGDGVTVGAGSTLYDGISIPDNCTIAAGSRIVQSIMPGCLYARGERSGRA